MQCPRCTAWVAEDQGRCPQCGSAQPSRSPQNGANGLVRPLDQSIVQRAFNVFSVTGTRPDLTSKERQIILEKLRVLSFQEHKIYEQLVIRYGCCGEDIITATGCLLLYQGLGWLGFEHWPQDIRTDDLANLEIVVHLLDFGDWWPKLEQCLLRKGTGFVEERSTQLAEDIGQVSTTDHLPTSTNLGTTSTPSKYSLELVPPYKDSQSQQVTERPTYIQERWDFLFKPDGKDGISRTLLNILVQHGYDEGISVGEISDELWSRGYGFSIDAVPWRASRLVSLKLHRRGVISGRETVAAFDAPTVRQVLAIGLIWATDQEG